MTTSYIASNPVPMASLPTTNGVRQEFLASTTNAADATFAPDGLAAAPIFGLGGKALQGSEIVSGGVATLVSYVGPLLNSGALCWVLLSCDGGTQQVAAGTGSNQAATIGQVIGLGQTIQDVTSSRVGGTTYTNGTGKPIYAYISLDVGTGQASSFTINGIELATFGGTGPQTSTYSNQFLIPVGATYSVFLEGSSIQKWVELR